MPCSTLCVCCRHARSNFCMGCGGGRSVAWLWWFSRWVQVREWQQQIIARARKEGYTRTLMGRYRELPLINSPNAAARGHAARAAINTPIQGAVGVFFLLKVDAHPPPSPVSAPLHPSLAS